MKNKKNHRNNKDIHRAKLNMDQSLYYMANRKPRPEVKEWFDRKPFYMGTMEDKNGEQVPNK